jgi:anti-anti-sigma factor
MNSHDPQITFLIPLPSMTPQHRSDTLEVEGRFVGSKSGNAWVVRAVGEIDIDTAKKLDRTIGGMLDAQVLSVVVNLEDVAFVDSAGVAVFAKAANRLRNKRHSLYLVGASPHVRHIVAAAGLDPLIVLFDTDERALAAINRSAASRLGWLTFGK